MEKEFNSALRKIKITKKLEVMHISHFQTGKRSEEDTLQKFAQEIVRKISWALQNIELVDVVNGYLIAGQKGLCGVFGNLKPQRPGIFYQQLLNKLRNVLHQSNAQNEYI